MRIFFKIAAAWILLAASTAAQAAQTPIHFSSDRFVHQASTAGEQQQLLAQLNLLTGAGGKFKASVAASFQGVLDIVGTNVVVCYSLQACSAAVRGQKSVNACDSTGGTDVACADLLTDATTGKLVAQTIGGGTCPGTLGANCTIKIWYGYNATGQVTTACNGSDCDAKTGAGGISTRPTLITSGPGSDPSADFTASQSLDTFTTNLTLAQPYSMAVMACQKADRGGLDLFFGNNSANGALYWNGTPSLSMFAGSGAILTAATRNSWQRLAGAFVNGGAGGSSGMVDSGTLITGASPGAGGFSTNTIGLNVLSFPAIFRATEFVLYSADKSGNFTAIQNNQSSRFGSGSC